MVHTAPLLADRPHGFTGSAAGDLRQGPGSPARWAAVAASLGMRPSQLVLLTQVHGDQVLRAQAPTGPDTVLGAADAVITDTPGLLLAVRTADCVPVLLAAPGGVGAVHAGWRGVAAQIVPAAVRALCALVGCPPDQVRAVVGPHIGVGAYQVGPEVVHGIGASVPTAVFVRPDGDRARVDLGAAVAHQLGGVGVVQVGTLPGCTASQPGWFSYRRDGAAAGRQASLIALGTGA